MERPHQIIMAVRGCEPDQLDAVLKAAYASWHGLGGTLLVQLTNKLVTRTAKDGGQHGGGRGLALHEAWARLQAAGFSLRADMLGRVDADLLLGAADFELLLTLWPKLEGVERANVARGIRLVRDWVGVRFLTYWESPAGAACLAPDTLQRLRPLWEATLPTATQRLSPKRACGLGWDAEQTVALVQRHVDTNGDTTELVQELLDRHLLTPRLVHESQGLVGGLLSVAPAWLAEQILAGEVSLEAPQPTIVRRVAAALAASTRPMTKQNVRHLSRFVDECVGPVADKSDAMRVAIDSLVALISRVPAEGNGPARAALIGRVTGAFLDENGRSRQAQMPDPRAIAGERRNERATGIATYPVLLERLLPNLTLDELTDSARPPLATGTPHALPESLRTVFHDWTIAQLHQKQSSAQLLKFVRTWLTVLSTSEDIFGVWRVAVEAVNSWSFLLHSLEAIAPSLHMSAADEAAGLAEGDCRHSGGFYDYIQSVVSRPTSSGHVDKALVLEAHESSARVQLCTRWPRRFAADYGVRKAIKYGKLAASAKLTRLVPRTSNTLSETAAQLNDSLAPGPQFEALLRANPTMAKTKTKEEFSMLTDLVHTLDTAMYTLEKVADEMSALLCATWSDKGALAGLCNTHGAKLLATCVDGKHDVKPFLHFFRKCPNLGSKKGYLLAQLRGLGASPHFAGRTAAERSELVSTLHPLLAQAASVEDLSDYLHALLDAAPAGGLAVTGKTAELLYALLDQAERPTPTVLAERLKSWRFCTPPLVKLEEDVDAAAWDVGVADLSASCQAADEVPPPTTMVPRCELYRRFGEHGERIISAAAKAATPAQLHALFLEQSSEPRKVDKSFAELCSVAITDDWRPTECPADQVTALLDLIGWFPSTFARCAPLVYASGTEEQVTALLGSHAAVDLDTLPQPLWGCLCFEKCSEADLLRLAKVGIDLDLDRVDLSSLSWSAQKLLLDALGSLHGPRTSCELFADHAPKVVGPITSYLERVFELLAELQSTSPKKLIELGDGLEDEERKVSGWNKLLHRLLIGVRDRVKGGNTLHTDEQLILFKHCATPSVDGANSTVLADLIEGKHVDPNHVFALVKFVLGARGFHHKVRDSALRAMMRLEIDERDEMHRTLLKGAVLVEGADGTYSSTLSLQVLFSLCVTRLAADVQPLVGAQLEQLGADQWDELLELVADANPAGGQAPHTYPRSLAVMFNERFLARYLRDAPSKRDPRYFRLFVACTRADAIPRYLLGVLSRQAHELDSTLFLPALTTLRRDEFVEVLEYFNPNEWPVRIDWVLERIRAAAPRPSEEDCVLPQGLSAVGRAVELLDAALDVLAYPAFDTARPALLVPLLTGARTHELLDHAEVRDLLRERLPRVTTSTTSSGVTSVDKKFFKVWITFFRECWQAGSPLESPAELAAALQISEQFPLSRDDVTQLGVNVEAMKMLVELAPLHALPLYGFAILKQEPSFAKRLDETQLLRICELTPQGLTEDKHWAVCRSVIAQVKPPSALRLSIALVCQSREMHDLDLVGSSYGAVDSFTRKQVWLPNELSSLWRLVVSPLGVEPRRFFGDAVLEMVESIAVAPNPAIVGGGKGEMASG